MGEDVQSILRTLELDMMIITAVSQSGEMHFTRRPGPMDIFANRFPSYKTEVNHQKGAAVGMSVPCLSCPLSEECSPGGRISPQKCEYLTDWLTGSSGAGL